MSPIESNLEGKFTLESGGNRLPEEAPFHILCLGNWSGNAQNEIPLEKRRPMIIDRDNFDDVIRKVRPKLKLEFDSGNTISLNFTEIDDFHPDNILRIKSELTSSTAVNKSACSAKSV